MDASTIRLILIVVGALAILLLYLWERQRERRERDEDHFSMYAEEGADAPYGVQSSTRHPEPDGDDDYDYDYDEPYDRPRQPAWSQPPQSIDERFGREAPDADDEQVSAQDSNPVMATPSLDPLLIQLSISARRYSFKGTSLMEIAESCGLYPGEMGIFHCSDEFDDHTRVYFSMANMIKPGTFAFDDMENFSTPGLMLFAQLEGDPEDMTILEEMIVTARKLGLALNGEVLDDKRRPLNAEKEEMMRQAVLDNEARWAQAKMR